MDFNKEFEKMYAAGVLNDRKPLLVNNTKTILYGRNGTSAIYKNLGGNTWQRVEPRRFLWFKWFVGFTPFLDINHEYFLLNSEPNPERSVATEDKSGNKSLKNK